VEPFLVTSGVIATASQRLVRRICPHCAELKQAPLGDIEAYQRVTGEEKNEFYYGAGCNQCSSTGHHGRIGVFELLPVTDSIRSLVTKQAGVTELKAQAQKDGMLPMSYHGMSLVKEGVTTPSEVARNVFTIS
jgi:type II secretory ATPase GspE/PulE/Tfp pilus assembly ATPase PilB-like protein